MLYGRNLRLPNQFYPTSTPWRDYPRAAMLRHQQNVASYQYVPTRFPTNQKVHMNRRFLTCSHVMSSNEHKRTSLDAPWTGPWKVLRRGTKTYTTDWKGKAYTVSIDRLQPLTRWLTSRNSPSAALYHCPLAMFLVLYATIVVLLLHHASVASPLRWIRNPQLFFILCVAECDQRLLACHVVALCRQITRIHGHSPFADLHSFVHNQRFLFSCTFLSVLCFIQRVFSNRSLFSAHVSVSFASKNWGYILILTDNRQPLCLQLRSVFCSIRGMTVLQNTKLVWILVSSALNSSHSQVAWSPLDKPSH